jgi:Skp family chaperone for outer membrane proteins
MNFRTFLTTGLAVGSVALSAPLANSATPSAAPPAAPAAAPEPPVVQGPPIPGYCVFSARQILGQSKVGQAVDARLRVLSQQVEAELQPEADGIKADERALQTQGASMDQATGQAKQANLQLRVTNFEKREQLRQQEMQATQNKQVGIILKQLDPILRGIYQQQKCSILVDGDAGGVTLMNDQMNLSPAAVTQLDAKLQTLTFDREHLDTAQAGAAGAPPAGGQ